MRAKQLWEHLDNIINEFGDVEVYVSHHKNQYKLEDFIFSPGCLDNEWVITLINQKVKSEQ